MNRLLSRAILPGLCLAVAACSAMKETPAQRAQRIEPMLSAAGFEMKPADSPDKLTHLQSMTPLKVRYAAKDGKFAYWFADPDYCRCIFTGDSAAYQRYQGLKLQSRMEQRANETAMMNEDAAEQEQLDWVAWPGPFLY
jgi:hypothetical protein